MALERLPQRAVQIQLKSTPFPTVFSTSAAAEAERAIDTFETTQSFLFQPCSPTFS